MRKITILILLFCSQAAAEPAWVSTVPKEDEEFLYYVGRSDQAVSEVRARKEAFTDAYEQAIQENFGFDAGFDRTDYQSDFDSKQIKSSYIVSKKIEFKDFQIVDSYLSRDQHFYNVQALYRYRKSAVLEAKKKLKDTLTFHPDRFSVAGDEKAESLGGVEIITKPFGARVSIDNEPYSKTPLKIVGQLKPGVHVVTIDHPNYHIIEEHIVVTAGQITKLKRVLDPAFGVINVKSDPTGAQVFLNKKSLNIKTPIQFPEAPAGKEFSLELRKEGYHTQIITDLKVERGATRTIKVRLTSTSNFPPEFIEQNTREPAAFTEEIDMPDSPTEAFIFTTLSLGSEGSPLKTHEALNITSSGWDLNLVFPSYFGVSFSSETGSSGSDSRSGNQVSFQNFEKQKLTLWLINSLTTTQSSHSLWQVGLESHQARTNLMNKQTGFPSQTTEVNVQGTGLGLRWAWISRESRSVFTLGTGAAQFTASDDKTSVINTYFRIGFGFSIFRGS